MRQVKELNLKSAYIFFDNKINIKDFQSNLLEIDKKSYNDINIYYIGYVTIKKFSDYENINNVNRLYLIIHSATGYFKEKNGKKYLIIDLTEKYEEVFSGIKSEIEIIMVDDDLPLNKPLKCPTLTITIRRAFPEGAQLYPQIYLDECFYEL